MTIEPNQAGTLTLAGDQSLEHGVFLNFDTTAGQLVIDRAKAASRWQKTTAPPGP